MLENRRFVIIGFFAVIGLIYLSRLFYLQVLDESYSIVSSSNSIKRVIEIPFRGQIYDRTGKLIVYNTPVYDLLVTPSKARVEDTLRFCSVLGIERRDFDSLMTAASVYSRNKPSIFLRQLSKEDFASIQDVMVDYSGFQFAKSSLRTYTAPTLANTLGYVSEITKGQLEKQEEPYYRQSDYIGQSGVEKIYENELRGKRGTKFIMQNVAGVYKGPWKGGELDTMAVAGANLYSGIDLEVQQYADSLMVNKVGSVVAIEPSTGQILTMVSAPTYDPNILASRFFSKNYTKLVRNPYKPLFNRPVMASYRPGSTFKLIQALVGLQEGVVTPGTGFSHANCPVGCHNHAATTSIALGVTHSCNPYFYHLFRRVIYNNKISNTFKASAAGLEDWHSRVSKFGIGQQLGIDLPSERKGNLPDKKYYDKIYGENAWKFSNIYSISIGEGEILITPLKMANVAAIIANRGYFYTPHVIHGVGDQKKLDPMYTTRHESGVSMQHFSPVIEGMIGAVEAGTAKNARIQDMVVAGKTGTSQNKKGDDHSIFIGFAPADNPKIAIAVFVENAGFGGSAAAPIAGLIMEKYLRRKITNLAMEKRMKETNLMSKVVLTDQQRSLLKSDTVKLLKPDTAKKKAPVIVNPLKK
ncbi:penicillin-binding transpeptidase domain-containing protein [Dyadobacter psychrotolerans]|uniref:Peptidoglycan glycosyltransferase n=1 Tax=Dyadobacter psychrotolerans TaxID=2541721 RepID=A0A4R5DBM3_9BACT|nr:penicillin-binding transpeptidase domain-containing protein [Dyadobacter psychrotolerans]TDE10307.1 peptidoglycan glycosyltransferase [Dyadobacter psychrotolerans]